jgi:hypothetical protein
MGKEAKLIKRLEADERQPLQVLVDVGWVSKPVRQRARVLLKADQAEVAPGWPDERVAEFAEVSLSTVHRVARAVRLAVVRLDDPRRPPRLSRNRRLLSGPAEIRRRCREHPSGDHEVNVIRSTAPDSG